MIYLQFPDELTARVTTGWWNKKSGWVQPTPALQIAVRGTQYSDAEYGNRQWRSRDFISTLYMARCLTRHSNTS